MNRSFFLLLPTIMLQKIHSCLFPVNLSLLPQATIVLSSVISFVCAWISYKWNIQNAFFPGWLLLLNMLSGSHPCCYVGIRFLFAFLKIWLSIIPSYKCTTFCLSILLLVGIWVVSIFCLL